MPHRWLIVDVNNASHKAFHSTGGLAHGGEPTGVTFGVLRDVQTLGERFATGDFVFAFDMPPGKREQEYPFYKAARRARKFTDEEQTARDGLRYQIDKLRRDYLNELGYTNVFYAKGYEADDVIASVVQGMNRKDEAIIVSSDHDLWQLLGPRVVQVSAPNGGVYTAANFRDQWGLHPSQWPDVKAIAGCGTDGVPGVPGVGEITAAKYVAGDSVPAQKMAAIHDYARSFEHAVNLKLVTLPYPGCVAFRAEPDPPRPPGAWDRLCERLGMRTLAGERSSRGPVRAKV